MRELLMASLVLSGAALTAEGALVSLPVELPKYVFRGTPKDPPAGVKLDPNAKEIRTPLMVIKGLSNLAFEKPVTASDKEPIIGELKQVTDGNKEGTDGNHVELGAGTQWVQVDLGAPSEIHAVIFWFHHEQPIVCHDVIVQTSNDADFIDQVNTLFNNDFDNSSGMGVGNDYEFYETYQGHLVDARKDSKPVVARYVRLHCKGSTGPDSNRFTELEVWGRPVNGGK